MAYDTTVLPNYRDLYLSQLQYGGDTVALGIMDYSYYKLYDDALNTPTYFNGDSVTLLLW